MTRLSKISKIFYTRNGIWLSWCVKTVPNPSPTRHQESRCKNCGTLCGNYTLYHFSFYLKTLDVKFNGQQILRRKCVFSNSSDSNDRFKEALKYLTLSFWCHFDKMLCAHNTKPTSLLVDHLISTFCCFCCDLR